MVKRRKLWWPAIVLENRGTEIRLVTYERDSPELTVQDTKRMKPSYTLLRKGLATSAMITAGEARSLASWVTCPHLHPDSLAAIRRGWDPIVMLEFSFSMLGECPTPPLADLSVLLPTSSPSRLVLYLTSVSSSLLPLPLVLSSI